MKRFTAALLTSVLILVLAFPAFAQDSTGPIVILHTNDIHSSTESLPAVAAIKKGLESQYGSDYVTLVDAGDAIQGSPIGTLSEGSAPVDALNFLGYDYAIPGNHEFDYSLETFLSLAESRAEYTYLACNFLNASGQALLAPYAISDYGEVQVAYVGIATPETLTKSDPIHFQDESGTYIYSFCEDAQGEALYHSVQSAVDSAREVGADYVVAIAHLGMNGSTPVWSSSSVIANTTGIDVMIDGHSHEVYQQQVANRDGESIPLVQTGTRLENLGQITIDPTADQITTQLIPLTSDDLPQDPDTAAFLAQLNGNFEEKLNQVISTTAYPLQATEENGDWAVRVRETNLGNLVADAYRWAMGADVALINGGGIRADIPAGDITYSSLLNVQPFGNELCLVAASGQEILDALEVGAMRYPESSGGLLQVSGLAYTINSAVSSSVVLSDHSGFVSVDGPYRVTDVMVGGQPLDLDKTYTVASHNFLIKSGGDGINVFQDNPLIKDCTILDNQALINYFTQALSTSSSAYQNPGGEGRITIVSEPVTTGPESQPEPQPGSESRSYTVRPGDSLWSIAARELGSGSRWQELYSLNRDTVRNPSLIYVGQVLELPQP